jgi:hypothetical protein
MSVEVYRPRDQAEPTPHFRMQGDPDTRRLSHAPCRAAPGECTQFRAGKECTRDLVLKC